MRTAHQTKFTLPALVRWGFPPETIFTSLEKRMKCGIGKCGRCNTVQNTSAKTGLLSWRNLTRCLRIFNGESMSQRGIPQKTKDEHQMTIRRGMVTRNYLMTWTWTSVSAARSDRLSAPRSADACAGPLENGRIAVKASWMWTRQNRKLRHLRRIVPNPCHHLTINGKPKFRCLSTEPIRIQRKNNFPPGTIRLHSERFCNQ
jgi:hypothetical protein